MATVEFSKSAGILSEALSQHHLSGFETAPASPAAQQKKERKKKKLKSDYTYTEYCCNEDNVRLIVFKIFNVENSAAATGLEKVSVHSNPTEGNAKECSNYRTVALVSHASKVMLKILQARLQQYMNCKLPDVQACFRKGRGTRDQIANIRWIMEKAREFQKNIYFCFVDCAKAFDSVDHNKLWKILKEMGIPEQLTCFLRNLYAGQEATVRTGHGTTDWYQIGKGVRQGCILSPCLFNFYAEYIMRNAGLEETQVGIQIAGRNINNLRYADDTTLMAESA